MNPVVSAKSIAIASAVAVFLVVVSLGEGFLQIQQREADDQRRVDMMSYAAAVRARIVRELNSPLYLTSGLSGYLVVRNDSIPAEEVRDILAALYKGSRHVRNFGVAIGYRLTYVYPVAGNENAVGLDYRELPLQLPQIERTIESGKPILVGPVALVQGGSGLIYRVPLFVNGKFWGLLSTVVDSESVFKSVAEESDDSRFAYSLRGKDGLGASGETILGDAGLFIRPDSVIQMIDIPGGRWAIAVAPRDSPSNRSLLNVRLFVAFAGGLVAWVLYAAVHTSLRAT